jgi:parallel beta-helix repeat protein
LQAGCGQMWDGIYADDASEQITLNNCTISDMENGITLQNLARISAVGNTFSNNYRGIFFNHILGAYNSTVGNCIVQRNTFNSTGGSTMLLPPHQNQNKTEVGILIFWCNDVQIGTIDAASPDPLNKNVFDNIYCGIGIITSNNALEAHQPLLLNNEFTNIHADYAGISGNLSLFKNTYTTSRGAGIFVSDFSLQPQILNNIHFLTVDNVVDANAGKFVNCDKAIVSNKMGAIIKNTKVTDCKFGFMHSLADGQQYLIGNQTNANDGTDANTLTNVHYGMQIIGNPDQVRINENTIVCNVVPMSLQANFNSDVTHSYPIGINELFYSNQNNTNEIRQNIVHLPAALGIGITAQNGGDGLILDRNTVNMTNNIKVPKSGYFGTSGYSGIEMHNCQKSTLLGNHVNGPSLIAMLASAKASTAIKIASSQQLQFECNHINHTRNGWWVQDDCNTGNASILNNDWNHHYFGILYTPLGSDGTLGDMGDPNTDYNFTFNGNYDNLSNQADADRLYRIVSGNNNTPQPVIYTNNITQAQSGSNFPGFEYFVYPTQNPLPVCSPTYSLAPGSTTGDDHEATEAYANQLVHDSIAFYANPSVAQWLAELRLYERIAKDTSMISTSEVLENFYDTRATSTIDAISRTNLAIARLTAPECLTDESTFSAALVEAQQQNMLIQSPFAYEQIEQVVNDIYFKTITNTSDTLQIADKQTIEALAKSCPLLNGSAVYKARTLWAQYEPWLSYDDLYICNNMAQNKNNSNGPFDFVLNQMNDSVGTYNAQQIPVANYFGNTRMEVSQLKEGIYCTLLPNPVQEQINIKYKVPLGANAFLKILNSLGQTVHTITLPSEVQIVNTSLANVSNGVYTYQFIVDGKVVQSAKLNIIH